jgi:hypothetical protein
MGRKPRPDFPRLFDVLNRRTTGPYSGGLERERSGPEGGRLL